jgi:hypothetical protein
MISKNISDHDHDWIISEFYNQNFLHISLTKLIVDEDLRKNMIPNPSHVSKCI